MGKQLIPSYLSLCNYKKIHFRFGVFLELIMGVTIIIEGLVVKEVFDKINGTAFTSINIYSLIALFIGIVIINLVLIKLFMKQSTIHGLYISQLMRRNILVSLLVNKGKGALVNPGSIQNSIRDDVTQIQTTIGWFGNIIRQTLTIIIAVVILVSISPLISILTIFPLLAIIWITRKFEVNIEKRRTNSREITGKVNNSINEVFKSILTIKVSGSSKNFINHIKDLNEKRNKIMIKDEVLSIALDSVYDNVNQISTGIILIVMSLAVGNGSLSLGDFTIFIIYLAVIFDCIESIANYTVYSKQTKVSVANIERTCNINSDSLFKNCAILFDEGKISMFQEDLYNDFNSLNIKNLDYQIKEHSFMLDGINLKLAKGERVAICGKNGSGKSILTKCILDDLNLDPNSCFVVDENKKINLDSSNYIAYAEQSPVLFNDTITSNLVLGRDISLDEVKKALKTVCLDSEIDAFADKENTKIGIGGQKLSGGQKQRLIIARMLLNPSPIKVIDDFSSSLDSTTASKVWANLTSDKNLSLLVISNSIEILKNVNKIYVLEDGRIINEGSFDELLHQSEYLREVINSEV